MKLFLVALLVVCLTLTAGMVVGRHMTTYINEPAEQAQAKKECRITLARLLSGEGNQPCVRRQP
jgi:hypothetical protein